MFATHKNRTFNLKNQYGLAFDGVNEYIEIFNGKIFNDNVGTITAWYYNNGGANAYAIGLGGTSFHVLGFRAVTTAGNHYINFVSIANSIVRSHLRGSTILANNTWYHLTWSSNGSTIKLYVNGSLETITVLGGTNNGDWFNDISPTGPKTDIGAGLYGGTYITSSCILDEICSFNSQLTDIQVLELYNGGNRIDARAHSATANLTGYWRLGDPDATFSVNWSIPDDSVNNNTGTSVNMEVTDLITGANL